MLYMKLNKIGIIIDSKPIHTKAILSIDGNNQLNSTATSGYGNISHPWILENYTISITDTSTDGIIIKNTNAYFILRNCIVTSTMYQTEAIKLDGVSNAKLMNNTAYNLYGIHLINSDNNDIINNTVDITFGSGIYLVQSDGNNITNNSATGTNYIGIHLSSSHNNTIFNNTANDNNDQGMILVSSNNNTLENNTIIGNSFYGLSLSSSNNNTIKNNEMNETTIYHGLCLQTSHNNTIMNNKACENKERGFFIENSDNNSLIDNVLYKNEYGIYFEGSNNNTNNYNGIYNNTVTGVLLSNSDDNNVTWNKIWDNTKNIDVTGTSTGNIIIPNFYSAGPVLQSIQPNPDYDGEIELNWSSVVYMNKYYVYRDTSYIASVHGLNPLTSVTDTNYSDPIPLDDTYYYTIVAGNSTHNSSHSNIEQVTAFLSLEAPNLQAIIPSFSTNGSIKLNWTNVIGADFYFIYRDTSNITTVAGLTPIAKITKTNYIDNLTQNNTFYYVLIAGNVNSNSSQSNCENVTVEVILKLPEAPFLFEILPNISNTGIIELNWSYDMWVISYFVYRSTSKITSLDGLLPIATVFQNNFTDNIIINGTYFYVIVASNASGNSIISNCVNITVVIPSNSKNPPPETPPIPGFEFFMLFLSLILIGIIIQLKKNSKRKKIVSF